MGWKYLAVSKMVLQPGATFWASWGLVDPGYLLSPISLWQVLVAMLLLGGAASAVFTVILAFWCRPLLFASLCLSYGWVISASLQHIHILVWSSSCCTVLTSLLLSVPCNFVKSGTLGHKHSKCGPSPLNWVPGKAEQLSKKKYKPAPTRMLSKPDSSITHYQHRMMIRGHLLIEGAPMWSEWYGDNGTIAKTLTLVGLPWNQASWHLIAQVFAEVENCINSNTDYSGITKEDRPPVPTSRWIINLEESDCEVWS
jgi:hypothetical protein